MNYQNNGKNEKSAQMRTIYITLALALVVMGVLVALSGAWRRNGDNTPITGGTTEAIATIPDQQVMAPKTENNDTTAISTETKAVAATVAEELTVSDTTTAEPAVAEPVLPEFVAPVCGYLMKNHSGDVPVFSITMNDYRPHTGVDVSASLGDDVFAVASGVVSEIWEDPMSGNCISITHDAGAVSIYKNLSPNLPSNITIGASVSAGEVIASIGDSSLLEIADDPHLHFELMIDGEAVDPCEYVSFPEIDTGYEG